MPGSKPNAVSTVTGLHTEFLTVLIRGNSYRMGDRRNLAQALRQAPARKNPEQGPATPAETPR